MALIEIVDLPNYFRWLFSSSLCKRLPEGNMGNINPFFPLKSLHESRLLTAEVHAITSQEPDWLGSSASTAWHAWHVGFFWFLMVSLYVAIQIDISWALLDLDQLRSGFFPLCLHSFTIYLTIYSVLRTEESLSKRQGLSILSALWMIHPNGHFSM